MQWTCHKCDSTIIGYRPEHCTVCHETFTSTRSGDMHRTLWTVTLDGAIYGPQDWQPLTDTEAEDLHDMIDMIDVDAIIAEATR